MAGVLRHRRRRHRHPLRPRHLGRLLADLPPGQAPAICHRRPRARSRRAGGVADLGAAGTDDHLRPQLPRAVLAAGIPERPEPRPQLLPSCDGGLGQPARRVGDRLCLARRGPCRGARGLGVGSLKPRAQGSRAISRDHHRRIAGGGARHPARTQPLSVSVPDPGQRGAAEAHRRVVLARLPPDLPAPLRGDGVHSDRGVRAQAAAPLRVPAHDGRARVGPPVGAPRRAVRGGRHPGHDRQLFGVLEGAGEQPGLEVEPAGEAAVRRDHGSRAGGRFPGCPFQDRLGHQSHGAAEARRRQLSHRRRRLACRAPGGRHANVQPVRLGRLPRVSVLPRSQPKGLHLRRGRADGRPSAQPVQRRAEPQARLEGDPRPVSGRLRHLQQG